MNSVKKLYKLTTLLLFGLFIFSCTGEKGDIGPQGDTGIVGQNGSDGLDGAQGPTGNQGETGNKGEQGETGSKGETPQLAVSFTDWKAITGFTEQEANEFFYHFSTDISVNLSNVIPASGDIDFSNYDGYLTVRNKETKLPVGLLYRYFKVSEDGEDFVFIDEADAGSINITTSVFGIFDGDVSVYTNFYFTKSVFGESADKVELAQFISNLNPSVRFVFLPLSLKARTASIDMTDYKAVEKAFNL